MWFLCVEQHVPHPRRHELVTKTVIQYINEQLADSDSLVNDKLHALVKELEIVKASKESANASLAQTKKELETVKKEAGASLAKLQKELQTIKQALDTCNSIKTALSNRADMLNDSTRVVKTIMVTLQPKPARNNTASSR